MKIVVLSDSPMNSGFGRISNEVFLRLAQRGHQVHIVSLLWDGVMVEKEDWWSPTKHPYPFQISGCAGRDIYAYAANIVNLARPDIVMSVQDFPYAQMLFYNCRIDWSHYAFALITPIDGYPIAPEWLRTVDDSDGAMVISEFGVRAMKEAGRQVGLCPPGINRQDFRLAGPEEKLALRERAHLPADAWILGMMAMNQGRKDIPHTLDGFAEFQKDKPNARLLMDMDRVSPAGWDIPRDAKNKGIPENKIIYKEDLIKLGLGDLRDRYALLDAHAVLSHREGFGLPLVESQAMKIPTIALDWCSGTEICGDGKGYLVRTTPQHDTSTWGGALDKDPDVGHFVQILESIYTNPVQAAAVADKGYKWAIARTWDIAANNVEDMLLGIMEKRGSKNESSIGNRAGLWGTTQSPAPVPDISSQSAGEHAGSDSHGRQLEGVQPDPIGGDSVPSASERKEPGVLRQRKRRSKTGITGVEVSAVPEQ